MKFSLLEFGATDGTWWLLLLAVKKYGAGGTEDVEGALFHIGHDGGKLYLDFFYLYGIMTIIRIARRRA